MQKRERTLWAALVVLSLVLVSTAPASARVSYQLFPDVQEESVFADSIRHYVLLGIIQGYQSGFFGPDDFLTRAQAAILFHRYERKLLAPLHEQMQEVRAHLKLGVCGDGVRGTGEACDDGNKMSGDGCSEYCLEEELQTGCPGGYEFGEQFIAEDGCNTCICTQAGIACTKMACFSCDPIVCEDGSEHKSCTDDGRPLEYLVHPCDNIVEEIEDEPDWTKAPVCGNGICDPHENELPPDRRFHCPADCTGEEYQLYCEDAKQEIFDFAQNHVSCTTSADCKKIEQSCPFITCGIAVNRTGYPGAQLKLQDAMDTCRREGNITACALCVQSTAYCEQGRCILKTAGQ